MVQVESITEQWIYDNYVKDKWKVEVYEWNGSQWVLKSTLNFNYQNPNCPWVKKYHYGKYDVNYKGLYKPCNVYGQAERYYKPDVEVTYEVHHLLMGLEDNYPNGDNDFADVILCIAVYKDKTNNRIMVLCDGILGKGDFLKKVYWYNVSSGNWLLKLEIDQKFHDAEIPYRWMASGCKQLLHDQLLPDSQWPFIGCCPTE